MHLKEMLLKGIKTIFGDTRQTIVSIIVIAVVGGSSSLLCLSKTTLDFCLQLLRTPIPLWATIFLILLCGLYMYLKGNQYFQKKRSYHPQEDLIPVGKFKWKVLHANRQVLNIEGLPYCSEHECSFIPRDSNWACPISGCKSNVSKYDLDSVRVAASSIIESLIRQKKC